MSLQKAWLGGTVYGVTAEQLDKLNKIAEEVYQKTGDRSKGLEAAIKHCKDNKFPVVKKAVVMNSQVGELLEENPEKMQEMFNKMFAEAMKDFQEKNKK